MSGSASTTPTYSSAPSDTQLNTWVHGGNLNSAPASSSTSTSDYLAASSYLVQAGGQISGAISSYGAAKAQAAYQNSLANQNAEIADMHIEDILSQGNKQAQGYRKQVKGLVGSERAAAAAQGIEVNTGTSAEIQAQTASQGALNILTIKNNAWREAFGYKAQSLSTYFQDRFNALAANNQANATLLTGGLSALGSGTMAAYYGSGGSRLGKKEA